MPGDRASPRTGGRLRAAHPGRFAFFAFTGLTLAGCGAGGVSPTPSTGPAVSAPPSAGADAHLLTVLEQAWAGYKHGFIDPGGRVGDPTRGGITTSEGQSYALLRAVWMDDRPAFDAVWGWTRANLQVRGDGLFAAQWGGGAVQDHNSASDADSDIALALLFAAHRFAAPAYHDEALAVLAGMWQHDVVSIAGMNVLAAGNWAATQQSPGPVVNPSYFAPYAYRVFAREDTAHHWMSLVDSSYTVLDRCTSATLDGRAGAGLPPNWCAIARGSGRIVSFPQISGADDYGYDAFRVMWRVALDALWNHEQRARDYLGRHDFLRTRWAAAHRLDAVYGHDGTVVSGYEDPTIYGGDIGNFLVADPHGAAQIEQLLLTSYHPGGTAFFGDSRNYFEQNWVWFGLALAGGALPDLAGG
ncbi:MAG TPA: glycosyl hydrolase family 8 [Candidatus Dormibacteraeota bacterium]|nr:glycosyl hydrolase family 8 [Candidatus Dormibacteraeota bacterium]